MIVLLRRVTLGLVVLSPVMLVGCSNAGATCARPSDCMGSATCVLEAGGANVCATLCTPDAGTKPACESSLVCQPLPEVGCCAGCACGTKTVCR